MTERPSDGPHVVDASVAVSWLLRLPDEAHGAQAERLFADHAAGRVHLLGPPHLPTEVGSALLKAVRRERITPERGRTLMEEFRRLRIRELPAEATVLAAWDMAQRFGCSYHDAGYLALADALGCPYVHADEKLRDKLAGNSRTRSGSRTTAPHRSRSRLGPYELPSFFPPHGARYEPVRCICWVSARRPNKCTAQPGARGGLGASRGARPGLR